MSKLTLCSVLPGLRHFINCLCRHRWHGVQCEGRGDCINCLKQYVGKVERDVEIKIKSSCRILYFEHAMSHTMVIDDFIVCAAMCGRKSQFMVWHR